MSFDEGMEFEYTFVSSIERAFHDTTAYHLF